MNVTNEMLRAGLHELGIAEGDAVLMHSSLSSFGHLQGGSDTLIDAVQEALGEEGTLLMPTLTYGGSLTLLLRETSEIDLRYAPSFVGRVTETARLRPDFLRSIHPTHPVVGKGKLARELLSEHHLGDSVAGSKSPFAKLAQQKQGKVLLVGVGHSSNTLIHTAEEYFTPYVFNGETFTVKTTGIDGSVHDVIVKGYCVGFGRNFSAVQPYLEKAHQVQQVAVGSSILTVVEAAGLLETLEILLRKDPRFLLAQDARP